MKQTKIESEPKWISAFGIAMLVMPLLAPFICLSLLFMTLSRDEGYAMVEAEISESYVPPISEGCRALADSDIAAAAVHAGEQVRSTFPSDGRQRFCSRPSSDKRLQSSRCNRESPA